MNELEAFNAIDEALSGLAKKLDLLSYCEPTNLAEQKANFLSSGQEPDFRYKPLEYDPVAHTESIQRVEIPQGVMSEVYNQKKQVILLENRINTLRGNPDAIRQATIEFHGRPSDELVSYADTILENNYCAAEPKETRAEVVQQALENAIAQYGLEGWKVELSDKWLTTVKRIEKKITVCKNRLFEAGDPTRLAVHEVGVHVIRAENGYQQPLKIFAMGFPGYAQTEEGLTSHFEEVAGVSSAANMRDYAGRVIAVDSVCRNLTFKQTFDRLKAYKMDDEQAWNLSVRAHRGGGYVKDHVYLEGHLLVKAYARRTPDFPTLYIGKIGIEDLPLVKGLLNQGVLKTSKYLPPFVMQPASSAPQAKA